MLPICIIVNNISPEPTRIIDGSLRDVNRLIDRVEADVDLLKQKVKNICQVTYAEATDIKQEFVGFAKGAASSLEGDVNRVGNIIVDDTKDLLHQATNRMKNENAVVDLFILLMIGIILLGIIYLYILTRSTSLLVVSILATIEKTSPYLYSSIYSLVKNEANLDSHHYSINNTCSHCGYLSFQ